MDIVDESIDLHIHLWAPLKIDLSAERKLIFIFKCTRGNIMKLILEVPYIERKIH